MTDARTVAIPLGTAGVHGDLVVPAEAFGIVVLAHGSGSSRLGDLATDWFRAHLSAVGSTGRSRA